MMYQSDNVLIKSLRVTKYQKDIGDWTPAFESVREL